ncbi:MAG TPA: hypothetical protein VFF94_03670, partial [Novosphingobium sp.]|nr:hypothetical protein [Novosphingobium sp.]
TPMDIAFIGTSHTLNGVDGLAVARGLAQAGVRAPDGRCLTVTNLAIPAYGRNMQWAVAREVLRARHPRLLVLEVLENETRTAHPLFYRVAETADVLGAPKVVNGNYMADVIRLPWRQLVLWAQSLAPAQFGLKAAWSAADYDGSTVDNTRIVNVHGQEMTPLRDRVFPASDLRATAAADMAAKRLHILPPAFDRWEYALTRRYLTGMLDLADSTHTPVLLLYLPAFGRPDQPMDRRWYGGRAMVGVNDILRRPELWNDPQHVNAAGAAAISARLGQVLAARLGAKGPHDVAGCAFGYGPRAVLQPWRAPYHPAN